MTTRDEALAAAAGNYEKYMEAWKMKPEGITDAEWQYYQNADYRHIPPHLKTKVHLAMGWKVKDTEDAEEIAGLVVKALDGKGHVPEENLERYRQIKTIAEILGSLGGRVSGYGEYTDANLLWALELKYQNKANELRADLPQKEREEE